LEGHRLDAHEARRDGLGEYRLTLLFAFQVRGADVRRAVGDVREGPVGLLTRQHLELRHHLVVAAATLGHDGRDGANLAGIDGEVLPGGVCAREPSFTAVEHAPEVAVARLVVVQRRRRAAGFVRRVQQLGLGKRRQVLDDRVLDHLQAAAHGDVSSVSLRLDPDVSRRDGLQEQRLDLVVAPLAVADERGAVVNLHVRAAELVRHRHLVDLDVLVLVLAVLHDDAHDGHHVPGVHDVELLVVVPAAKPALVAVEHAGVVAVARLVVAVGRRHQARLVGGVHPDDGFGIRDHALLGRRAGPLPDQKASAHRGVLVPRLDLDAHVARRHRVSELHVLDHLAHRVADEQSAVVDVREVGVGRVRHENLERSDHLVGASAGLHGDTRDGLYGARVHGHPLTGALPSRNPSAV